MTCSRAGASKAWKWKWNGKVLLACKSAVCSNEYFPQWMLFSVRFGMSNQIKSNQIILSNITYPIQRWILCWFPWIWVGEGRSKQSSKHNSLFISFQFTYFSWLMCCHNFHDRWLLFCDYLPYHLQEHVFHWMKWYVVLEDLEWEMKWKWIIITYFQIQQDDNI